MNGTKFQREISLKGLLLTLLLHVYVVEELGGGRCDLDELVVRVYFECIWVRMDLYCSVGV